MQAYGRDHATDFHLGESIDEAWQPRDRRVARTEYMDLREPIRLALFEDWRELSLAPIFQLHCLTEDALTVLKAGPYGAGSEAVKALLVERIYEEAGEERFEVVGISIKVPSTREIRRRRGLLVYAYADQPGRALPVRQDTLGFLSAPTPGGLYMTQTTRVLSLTRYHVRLCMTSRIGQACSWGSYDRLTGGDDRPPSDEEIRALGDLAL